MTWLLRAVETQAGLEEGLAIILTDRIGSLVRFSIERKSRIWYPPCYYPSLISAAMHG